MFFPFFKFCIRLALEFSFSGLERFLYTFFCCTEHPNLQKALLPQKILLLLGFFLEQHSSILHLFCRPNRIQPHKSETQNLCLGLLSILPVLYHFYMFLLRFFFRFYCSVTKGLLFFQTHRLRFVFFLKNCLLRYNILPNLLFGSHCCTFLFREFLHKEKGYRTFLLVFRKHSFLPTPCLLLCHTKSTFPLFCHQHIRLHLLKLRWRPSFSTC